MKKIGFIDYYISEWHANNYPSWIKDTSERMGEDFAVCYAYAKKDVSPVDGRSTDEWCKDMGIEKCDSIAELCEKSDYVCILAPSNPEEHLALCEEAFKSGKLTYVDKTFAGSFAEAQKIFELGEKTGTKFFTSSALRYASELSEISGYDSLIVSGAGSNFDEYIIHLCEIAVKLLGCDVKSVSSHPQGKEQYAVSVEFSSGKSATLVLSPSMPYSVCAEGDGISCFKEVKSKFFLGLIEDMLRFYNSGEASFDSAETLAVMKLREAAILSRRERRKIEF